MARWAQSDARPLAGLDALRRGLEPPRVRRIDRWFAPRQFVIRATERTSVLHLSQRLQITVTALFVQGVAGLLAATAVAAWQQQAADRMAREIEDLRGTARLETRHAAEAEGLLHRLWPQLWQSVAERDQAANAAHIAGRTLTQTRSDIDRLVAERSEVANERDRALAERDAALSANREMLLQLDARTRSTIARVEGIIASTGFNPGRAVNKATPAAVDRRQPRGGPFVPWPVYYGPVAAGTVVTGQEPPAPGSVAELRLIHGGLALGLERLQALLDFLPRLPIGSPLTQVEVASGFGFRIDPFRGFGAMHEGVDLAGRAGAPVFATAAGIVVFAGWKGEYGNLVEIDHGLGLVTRYAHLSSIIVRTGEIVALHQPLGLIGATGATTGAHLHYEIRVDGQARNPVNFLRAARNVQ